LPAIFQACRLTVHLVLKKVRTPLLAAAVALLAMSQVQVPTEQPMTSKAGPRLTAHLMLSRADLLSLAEAAVLLVASPATSLVLRPTGQPMLILDQTVVLAVALLATYQAHKPAGRLRLNQVRMCYDLSANTGVGVSDSVNVTKNINQPGTL